MDELCFFASLLLLVVLIFSPIGSTFGRMPTFTSTSYDIAVRNEAELQKAVYSAQPGVPLIIALNTDIVLKSPFTLNYHKNITLTSNRATGFYKLIGPLATSSILIGETGVLQLDGIIVTHAKNTGGVGVHVNSGGTLILHRGEISGNKGNSWFGGGGVANYGYFEMVGGAVSNNDNGGGMFGGGVTNQGTFVMSGGEISNNNASGNGGGVDNYGLFEMTGGKISNNNATNNGGGVHNHPMGTVNVTGGAISNNTASKGNNVYKHPDGAMYYFGVQDVVIYTIVVIATLTVCVLLFYCLRRRKQSTVVNGGLEIVG